MTPDTSDSMPQIINLNKCKPGDKLVCRDGMVLEYLRITSVSARFRHIAGDKTDAGGGEDGKGETHNE